MGIEKFFNSLKKDFKIDNFTSKNKYNFDYILFDFNSIIHVISQKVNILLEIVRWIVKFAFAMDGDNINNFKS